MLNYKTNHMLAEICRIKSPKNVLVPQFADWGKIAEFLRKYCKIALNSDLKSYYFNLQNFQTIFKNSNG